LRSQIGLGDLDAEVEINSAWETIKENIKISAKESLDSGLLEIPSLTTIYTVVCFFISYCRYMFLSLFDYPQAL
jgi:hypothetical protein